MTKTRYFLGDVFATGPFGGNQLAVFPDAAHLSESVMPSIARELNLSETVFVLPSRDPRHTRRIRIFTPGMELPFAGHPTIGTAALLYHHGIVTSKQIVLEEGVGPVEISIDDSGSLMQASFRVTHQHEWREVDITSAQFAALLGLEPAEIGIDGHDPAAISAGVPFTFIPVRDKSALSRAHLNLEQWRQLLSSAWAPHVYIFTIDDGLPSTIRSRMFSPAMAITEDPATGAAAAAIASYLPRMFRPGDGRHQWRIEQGHEINRPSIIHITASVRDGILVTCEVGGTTVPMGEGYLFAP